MPTRKNYPTDVNIESSCLGPTALFDYLASAAGAVRHQRLDTCNVRVEQLGDVGDDGKTLGYTLIATL